MHRAIERMVTRLQDRMQYFPQISLVFLPRIAGLSTE